MEYSNYYKVLQVDVEAEADVVKAAYRALSRKYHPDGSHPSAERMMRLNDAYAVLSDPQSRARYNDEIERRGIGMSPSSDSPGVTPPLRYRETTEAPPRPRRQFRRSWYGGVATQIALFSFCLLGLVLTGLLRPFSRASAPPPTPTPQIFQQTADDLMLAFEEDGFTFAEEMMLSGEPLSRGVEDSQVAAVYIGQTGGAIQYASLLLAADEDLTETDLFLQEQALIRLLDAAFTSPVSRDQARQWILSQQSLDDPAGETVISGWLIRMWSAPEQQIGIVVRPYRS